MAPKQQQLQPQQAVPADASPRVEVEYATSSSRDAPPPSTNHSMSTTVPPQQTSPVVPINDAPVKISDGPVMPPAAAVPLEPGAVRRKKPTMPTVVRDAEPPVSPPAQPLTTGGMPAAPAPSAAGTSGAPSMPPSNATASPADPMVDNLPPYGAGGAGGMPRTPAGGMNQSQASQRSSRPPPISTPSSARQNLFPSQSHSNLAEIAEAFRILTHENAVDASGLVKLMRAHGQQPTEEEVRDLIKAIDQRGDGIIRFNEFTAVMAQPVELEEIEEMKLAFLHLDRERKGWIPAADFTRLFATYGEKSTPEECDEMLRFADPDETGKVDYNSFLGTLAYRLQPRL
jgi:calmodulin